ncbi:D-galactarolactone cycloisomerase [Paenibacillus sp. UNCCL117]|uniref:mandelate racemase/muconate lactonizing enzyme family protein n=1 Tax=unclassified Paenibacillus TaxID=185978 RepID=UPI00087EA954|nr:MULTISPECIES: mandelate racemase/muconate lactonizing enzyme family protein [unclassified Paenibacillus]SDE55485.1 D-galactarolactone cycloisomerase [Paenibacillus sp. cl123]SFW66428.1 D-galactarolactone cycloisomerase [Paenibacillus sp. UNCCL117]
MKVTNIEVYIVKLRPTGPVQTAGKRFITPDYFVADSNKRSCVYSVNSETVFVKVSTDEGIAGWGEILAPTNPEVVATILKHHLAPMALGQNPMQNQVLWDRMLDTLRERGYTGGYLVDAMAGLDIAFWDIKGKALGQPVYMLLGGKYRDKLRCYCSSVPGADAKERLEHVIRLKEEGFDAIKFHTFGKGKKADLEGLYAIRGEFGPDEMDLMLDAHGKYTHSEAYTVGRALGELDAIFFEAPITFEDREGHRKLAEAIDTAVAVGEPLRTIYTFKEWIASGAVEVLQPDMGRNGITEMMRIAHLAEAFHLTFAPHLSAHQAVGHAASIHVSAAISNFLIYEYQPNALQRSAPYSNASFRLEKGHIVVPNDPGLGVEIDEQAMRGAVTEYFEVKA